LKADDEIKADGDEKLLEMKFDTPAETDSGDLTLSYQRQPGTARLHGYYQLMQTELHLAGVDAK
jgi:hypothetical protein